MTSKGELYEIACEQQLKSDYSCKVVRTSITNDGGKDIIIYSPEGKIFVECKDWRDTPVGRPVIQKLHSAVITEGAVKGIIMTTGTYSQEAYDYVKKYNLPIELKIYIPDKNTYENYENTVNNRNTGFFGRLFAKQPPEKKHNEETKPEGFFARLYGKK